MPNPYQTLGNAPITDNTDYLTEEIQFDIDSNMRTIAIPSEGVVIGVQGDKNVNRVNFRMPAWYNGFDMSTFQPRINFVDPEGNVNYYTVTDMKIYDPDGNEVTDTPTTEDIIYFTWLVDSYATNYVGTVVFNVRFTKFNPTTHALAQAFNTTKAACQVLEGITLADEITQEQQEDLLFHMTAELQEVTDKLILDIEAKGAETRDSIPDDYTSLANDINGLKKDIGVRSFHWERSASSMAWKSSGYKLEYTAGEIIYIQVNNAVSDGIYLELHSENNINSGTLISYIGYVNSSGFFKFNMPSNENVYLTFKTNTAQKINTTFVTISAIQANQYTKIETLDNAIGYNRLSDTYTFETEKRIENAITGLSIKNGDVIYLKVSSNMSEPFTSGGIQILLDNQYLVSFGNGYVNKWIKTTANRNCSKIGLYTNPNYAKTGATFSVQFANNISGTTDYNNERIETIIDNIGLGLNPYYKANGWIGDTISNINKQISVINGVSFPFFTDLHFNKNTMQSKWLIKEILDHTSMNFAICGGDFVRAYKSSGYTNEQCVHMDADYWKEYCDVIGKDRIFSVRGNHDFTIKESTTSNNGYTLQRPETYNIFTKSYENFNVSVTPGQFYYYIDNPVQKTRIFMLSSCDSESSENTPWGVNEYVSSEQIEWLIQKITEKSGWRFIFVSHVPADSEISSYSESQDELHKIMVACKNKTSYGNTSFANDTNEVICHIVGHNHKDESHVDDGVLTISTTSDANYEDGGWFRGDGTVYEQAIDVFTFNYDTDTIKTYRVGGGESREWTY